MVGRVGWGIGPASQPARLGGRGYRNRIIGAGEGEARACRGGARLAGSGVRAVRRRCMCMCMCMAAHKVGPGAGVAADRGERGRASGR